jgi:hypothetical protein
MQIPVNLVLDMRRRCHATALERLLARQRYPSFYLATFLSVGFIGLDRLAVWMRYSG